ncbi:hypothetical protein [Streptomyces misionensis]
MPSSAVLNGQAREHRDAGQPVISVETDAIPDDPQSGERFRAE